MQLHYIYHSCFVAEEEDCLIVFDYWRDPQRLLATLLDGAADKEVYFIISHFHQDHYNPDIPQWCAEHANWHILPSYDTVRRRRIDKSLPLAVLRFGESVHTPHFQLKAYHSTDVGVCTLLTLRDGTTLFHAGDCNNWRFPPAADPSDADLVKVTDDQMEKLFLSILRDIRHDLADADGNSPSGSRALPTITHAMFPVDPRLGQEMLRGLFQLLEAVHVEHLHPMHYSWGLDA